MPDFVRVKVKETGAEITIDRINVNDTVEVLDKPATDGHGPRRATPHKNLRSELPVAKSTTDKAPNEDTTASRPSGRKANGGSK